MLSHRDIEELLYFKTEGPGFLSLYLKTDEQKAWLNEALALTGETRDPVLAELVEDFRAAREYVKSYRPGSRKGLALFSCRKKGLWTAVPLPLCVPTLLRTAEQAYLKPLMNLLDQYQRYGVALVSPDKERFLEVHMGEVEELPAEIPHEAAPSRRSGRVADPFQRRLKSVASGILDLARLRGWDRLILATTEDMERHLIGHLHTRLQDSLIVDRDLRLGMSPGEVLERIVSVERESRKVRESVLVYRLFDALKSGGMGTVGLPGTLTALHHGQVRMLLVREGLARMGRACRHCGAISLAGKKCAYCWLDTEPAVDIVGEMIQAALDQDAEVFELLNPSHLDSAGGVGAELSFRAPEASAPPRKAAEDLAAALPRPPGAR